MKVAREDGRSDFVVNSLDYETPNVFLIAKKIDPTQRLDLSLGYEYAEKWPLSGGAIAAIVVFVLCIVFSLAVAIVLRLNKQGIINIYIPKEMRVYCLKDIMTEEQIRVMEERRQLRQVVDQTKTLEYRRKLNPGPEGFRIEDSFFGEDFEPPNPNADFSNEDMGTMMYVKKKPHLSIDHEIDESNAYSEVSRSIQPKEDRPQPEIIESFVDSFHKKKSENSR